MNVNFQKNICNSNEFSDFERRTESTEWLFVRGRSIIFQNGRANWELILNLVLDFEGWIYRQSNKNTKQNSDEINKYIKERNEEMKNINFLKIILQGAEFPGVTFIKHAKNEFS